MVGINILTSDELRRLKQQIPYRIWRVLVLTSMDGLIGRYSDFYVSACGFNIEEDRKYLLDNNLPDLEIKITKVQ